MTLVTVFALCTTGFMFAAGALVLGGTVVKRPTWDVQALVLTAATILSAAACSTAVIALVLMLGGL